jgi:hypothetical protein
MAQNAYRQGLSEETDLVLGLDFASDPTVGASISYLKTRYLPL